MSEPTARVAIGAVAATGVALASYLVYVHYAGAPLACFSNGCETVQHSRYATLLGVPVALLGLAAYVTILATAFVRGELARALGLSVAVAGVAFGVYLMYVQVAVIHATCVWCLGSDAIMSVLAALALLRVRAGFKANTP